MKTLLHTVSKKANKLYVSWHYFYLLMITRQRIKALELMMESPYKGNLE
ncbi:MAG: hypothetical protein NTX03_12285 [Bacteroidetes bacterium]|nr:hypothetical protein [Bacteroidota bacterium]